MTADINFFKAWVTQLIVVPIVAVSIGVLICVGVGMVLGLLGIERESLCTIGCAIGGICGLYAGFYFYRWSIKFFILSESTIRQGEKISS